MTSINHVDQAIVMLRERLGKLRGDKAAPSAAPARIAAGSHRPIARLQQLAGMEGLPPADLRKALIRTLIAEALGEELANDASFLSVSDRVAELIEAGGEGQAMIDRALAELRGAG